MCIYIYIIVYNVHARMTTYLHILKTYMSVIMWVCVEYSVICIL